MEHIEESFDTSPTPMVLQPTQESVVQLEIVGQQFEPTMISTSSTSFASESLHVQEHITIRETQQDISSLHSCNQDGTQVNDDSMIEIHAKGKKPIKKKDPICEYFGKVLQTDMCQSILDRHKVKASVPTPMVPLCRMIMNQVVRPVRDDLTRLKNEFGKYGYVESKGTFMLSLKGIDGNEQDVTHDIVNEWDPLWREVNDEFEVNLMKTPEWSHLKNKMFFVWDGNNRLKAFMEKIKEEYQDIKWRHVRVATSFICFEKNTVGELLLALNGINRLNEAYVKGNPSDKIFQIRQFGQADKATLLKHLPKEEEGWMMRELQREATREGGVKPWYNVPLSILSQIVFKDEFLERMAVFEGRKDMTDEERKKNIEEVERHFRTKTYRLSQVANPMNGEEFFGLIMRIPWDNPKHHVASEEKLALVASSKISDARKANIMKLMINPSEEVRSVVYMPRDKYQFRPWIDLETFWIQLEDNASLEVINVIEQVDSISLPNSFPTFLKNWKRKYFGKLFKSIQGDMKHSNPPEKQSNLVATAKRLVFRWLVECVRKKEIPSIPPVCGQWCNVSDKESMYTITMIASGLNAWERNHCPWWIDFPKGQFPQEEAELRQFSNAEESNETQHVVKDIEIFNTSEGGKESWKGRLCKKKKMFERRMSNSSLQRGRSRHILQQYQDQTCLPSMFQLTPSIQPKDRKFMMQDVIELCSSSFEGGYLWKQFEDIIKIYSNNGNVRGRSTSFGAVELLFADFPTNIYVNGVQGDDMPYWNKWSEDLCNATFKVADSIMSDSGWFVALHSLSHLTCMDEAAKQMCMEVAERCTLHSVTPLGWSTTEPKKEMHCLVLSTYKRELYADGNINYGLIQHPNVLTDTIQEIVDQNEWVCHRGKPLRGASQRSSNFWDYIIQLYSKPMDLVVDLMCGTGSFLKIASRRGRYGIGIDSDASLPFDIIQSF